MALPPLTKRYPNGNVYERPPKIESAIINLLKENVETIANRANTLNVSDPEYVPSECIVHLMRAARRRDDELAMTALLPPLLRRCESILKSKISQDLPNADDIREEILSQFSELFAADGVDDNPNKLDFFEARFNLAFRAFRIDILRAEERRARIQTHSSLPTAFEDDGDPSSDDEFFARLSKEFHTPPSQENEFVLKQIQQAIYHLPPEEREAVVLCCVLGYEQESDDPKKRTAATICGVTGKTIRNRLQRAATRLSQFKELIQ